MNVYRNYKLQLQLFYHPKKVRNFAKSITKNLSNSSHLIFVYNIINTFSLNKTLAIFIMHFYRNYVGTRWNMCQCWLHTKKTVPSSCFAWKID